MSAGKQTASLFLKHYLVSSQSNKRVGLGDWKISLGAITL